MILVKGGGESCIGGIKEIFDFRLNIIRHLSRYTVFGLAVHSNTAEEALDNITNIST